MTSSEFSNWVLVHEKTYKQHHNIIEAGNDASDLAVKIIRASDTTKELSKGTT